MSIEMHTDRAWTRKHDDPRTPLINNAPRVYPVSLAELIKLCRERPLDTRLKASGSHWALSQAAFSDQHFVETHDPENIYPGMGSTLYNVIPYCLNENYIQQMLNAVGAQRWYPVHVEAGKRINQIYAELDQIEDLSDPFPHTLAKHIKDRYQRDDFAGPWAFNTLGGAGGQTIGGAFSTGTHGGDHIFPPIADSVLAIHLVADGGRHYWIEKVQGEFPMTDDDRLIEAFDQYELHGRENFEIVRDPDNARFNAALVSVGRFGIIYSVVLKAVPQFLMHERRRLHVWQDIKGQIKDLNGPLYRESYTYAPGESSPGRFLQIAVCLTPHANSHRNLAGVTKRWEYPMDPAMLNPPGRMERVGEMLERYNETVQGPRFARNGAAHTYDENPDPDHPEKSLQPSMLESACASSGFLRGILEAAREEIAEFVSSNGVAVGVGIAGVAAFGGAGLLALIPPLALALLILEELLDHFDDSIRFGEYMEVIKNALLNPFELDPAKRAAGIFTWQLIYYLVFSSQQSDRDMDAISYAMMDIHDYLNANCEKNVDSVEVFFDAVDDRLIAFIDALIAFELHQEFHGKAFAGYASLRFMGKTDALIGMQKYNITCAVEVAGLKDMSGSQELVDYAVSLARDPNMRGILHWGQRNDCTRQEIELRFGTDLLKWRSALAYFTADGEKDGFSSEFTRRTGLECN